jgi:hypothetical protein
MGLAHLLSLLIPLLALFRVMVRIPTWYQLRFRFSNISHSRRGLPPPLQPPPAPQPLASLPPSAPSRRPPNSSPPSLPARRAASSPGARGRPSRDCAGPSPSAAGLPLPALPPSMSATAPGRSRVRARGLPRHQPRPRHAPAAPPAARAPPAQATTPPAGPRPAAEAPPRLRPDAPAASSPDGRLHYHHHCSRIQRRGHHWPWHARPCCTQQRARPWRGPLHRPLHRRPWADPRRLPAAPASRLPAGLLRLRFTHLESHRRALRTPHHRLPARRHPRYDPGRCDGLAGARVRCLPRPGA